MSATINTTQLRSKKVLESTPERTMQFLRGVAFKPIRASMQRRGYTDGDHAEGWKLLQKACGYNQRDDETTMSDDVSGAIAELDAWDESGFRAARAALTRLHPEQCEYVFNGLKAGEGMQAVMGIITFLERLAALEGATERKATRKADHAALATLAKRGIGEEERKRLAALVKTVKSSPDLELVDEKDTAKAEADRVQALSSLRAWFEDWSDTARAAIGRRDHLIRLGLAKRKANGKIEDVADEEDETPTPPAPTPVA